MVVVMISFEMFAVSEGVIFSRITYYSTCIPCPSQILVLNHGDVTAVSVRDRWEAYYAVGFSFTDSSLARQRLRKQLFIALTYGTTKLDIEICSVVLHGVKGEVQ